MALFCIICNLQYRSVIIRIDAIVFYSFLLRLTCSSGTIWWNSHSYASLRVYYPNFLLLIIFWALHTDSKPYRTLAVICWSLQINWNFHRIYPLLLVPFRWGSMGLRQSNIRFCLEWRLPISQSDADERNFLSNVFVYLLSLSHSFDMWWEFVMMGRVC